MMDENVIEDVRTWATEQPGVEVSERDDSVDVTWQLRSGEKGFIVIYEPLCIQHGTYDRAGLRRQRGISVSTRDQLPHTLTALKSAIDDQPVVKQWSYTPKIEIGTVQSLKLH